MASMLILMLVIVFRTTTNADAPDTGDDVVDDVDAFVLLSYLARVREGTFAKGCL